MSMGEQIKAMRQIRGLTQGELAVKVEMATITIQQYERGVRTPKIEALQHRRWKCRLVHSSHQWE